MRVLSLTLSSLLLIGAAPRPPHDPLGGRTPGRPVSCIQQNLIDDSDVLDSGAIFYRMKGGPDYLNTPPSCPILRHDRGLASRTPGTSLCAGDIVQVIDFTQHFDYGSCGLGEFVPYPRAKKTP